MKPINKVQEDLNVLIKNTHKTFNILIWEIRENISCFALLYNILSVLIWPAIDKAHKYNTVMTTLQCCAAHHDPSLAPGLLPNPHVDDNHWSGNRVLPSGLLLQAVKGRQCDLQLPGLGHQSSPSRLPRLLLVHKPRIISRHYLLLQDWTS